MKMRIIHKSNVICSSSVSPCTVVYLPKIIYIYTLTIYERRKKIKITVYFYIYIVAKSTRITRGMHAFRIQIRTSHAIGKSWYLSRKPHTFDIYCFNKLLNVAIICCTYGAQWKKVLLKDLLILVADPDGTNKRMKQKKLFTTTL